MPVFLAHPEEKASVSAKTIEIAILNNMSDGGLAGAEQQFTQILAGAAKRDLVRVSLFSLPSIARSAAASASIAHRYLPFSRLRQSRVDGFIVTGCEPRTEDLPCERFWSELTGVIDWAEHNTRSTIWSCLAAHAAVLHLDGVRRQRLEEKCTGLFRIERVSRHPLLKDASDNLQVAHSRWNRLDREQLVAAGYEVLTESEVAGVDTFVKQWRSLFVYLQGHPEYDAGALGREYRRDVTRFLEGRSPRAPRLPSNYFEPSPHPALQDVSGRRASDRSHRSGDYAAVLVRNWIDYLAGRSPNGTAPKLADPRAGADHDQPDE